MKIKNIESNIFSSFKTFMSRIPKKNLKHKSNSDMKKYIYIYNLTY